MHETPNTPPKMQGVQVLYFLPLIYHHQGRTEKGLSGTFPNLRFDFHGTPSNHSDAKMHKGLN